MKGNLLLGTGRGKLGDVVGRVLHGEQVFSKYQPVVYNPKSLRQSTIRDFFKNASIQTKDVMSRSVEDMVGLYYSNVYGASRNARNLFTSVGMKARILQEDGLEKLGVTNVLPVSSIGQNFPMFAWSYSDETQLHASYIPNTMVPMAKLYFGSDVLLTDKSSFIGFGTAYSEPEVAKGTSSKEIPLVLTTNTVGSAIPNKSYGFFETLPEVTGWTYTYQLDLDPASGWETFNAFCNNIAIGKPETAFAFISWQDQNGRIIMQSSGSPLPGM
ncbi:MAG: hypothetical protein EOL95_10960 [Bacteroidia bacterium]|nr:hypothetical protein [Bacteroidia bacterium]